MQTYEDGVKAERDRHCKEQQYHRLEVIPSKTETDDLGIPLVDGFTCTYCLRSWSVTIKG